MNSWFTFGMKKTGLTSVLCQGYRAPLATISSMWGCLPFILWFEVGLNSDLNSLPVGSLEYRWFFFQAQSHWDIWHNFNQSWKPCWITVLFIMVLVRWVYQHLLSLLSATYVSFQNTAGFFMASLSYSSQCGYFVTINILQLVDKESSKTSSQMTYTCDLISSVSPRRQAVWTMQELKHINNVQIWF